MKKLTAVLLLLVLALTLLGCKTTPNAPIQNPADDSTQQPSDEPTACEHELVPVLAKAPTCTKVGWHDHTICSRCGYSTRVDIPALEHDYVDGVCTRCTAVPVSSHLRFRSNGKGGCTVSCSGDCTDKEVMIPHISPDGEPVTEIYWGYSCQGIKTVTFHKDSTIAAIGEQDFYNCDMLERIELPASIVTIDKEAFAKCDALKSVTFADGCALTSIGEQAFYQCKALEEVEWSALEQLSVICPKAFLGCTSLARLDAPKSLTKIDEWAFEECSGLKTVSFPSDGALEYIGTFAFNKCVGLEDVVLPPSLTYLSGDSFANILNKPFFDTVDGITYLGAWAVHWNWGTGDTVRFREGTVGIADGAVVGDGDLVRLEIPAGLIHIASQSIRDRDALSEIVVHQDNPVYHSAGNCLIETATKTVVVGCRTSVIPSDGSVTAIGENAFLDCNTLTGIVLPSGLERIEDFAFLSCAALKEIDIPEGVTSIGKAAFMSCDALTRVTLPSSLTTIATSAFSHAPALTSITIPSGVTRIEQNVFNSCDALSEVIFEETEGWYEDDGSDFWEDEPVDVSDAAANAETLKVYVYSSEPRYWYRK